MVESFSAEQFAFDDTSFAGLMNRRITSVLLIAAPYDAFMLEDGGRIEEQIFNEYTALSLHYAPRFTRVATAAEALAAMRRNRFDLVVCMPNMDNARPFAAVNSIRRRDARIPTVVLTPFSHEVTQRLQREDLSAVDYVFSWMGDADLLLAIIKLIEDRMNVEDDVRSCGVQTILLVEDSVRFCSLVLPQLYGFVLSQSKEFAKEALNAHEQTLRMRGRPKILLARNYEEAVRLYRKFSRNMLGVVSDMSFLRNGEKDRKAGLRFGRFVRRHDRHLPLIFDSSDPANIRYAEELGCSFIDKNSKTFAADLHREIMDNFGFGDFVIIDPDTGREVDRITSLQDLQHKIFDIGERSLFYHLSHNHFSRFLYSRAIFPVARCLKEIDISQCTGVDGARRLIFDAVVSYRRLKNSGVVASFDRDRFDEYSSFARIGNDSLGGKGRGLAFIGQAIKMRSRELRQMFPDVDIRIPKTLVLCTDVFDEFMEANGLYDFALQDRTDGQILRRFLRAALPRRTVADVKRFLEVVRQPVVVRSSSLLEDAQYQPFAGIYKTYMVAPDDDLRTMSARAGDAIKAVYASVFYRDSKAYLTATRNVIDREKMAIVLQEVAGHRHGDRFYPTFSGVARSLNCYPVGSEQTDDGIASVALGLGKYIVDGGLTLRFSPRHPHAVLQTSSVEYALKETQTRFCALDISRRAKGKISTDDAYNLLRLPVKEAGADGELAGVCSTFDPQDGRLMDGFVEGAGRRVITFAGVLQNGMFPLAAVLDFLLGMGQREMGRPVEIEFAVNLERHAVSTFYVLQLRPIASAREVIVDDLSATDPGICLLKTEQAMGHGISTDVCDVVYVRRPATRFEPKVSMAIAAEIGLINDRLTAAGRPYILVGPGRWGSSDPWLGIPVSWPQIAGVRLIVELGEENYRVEPSQGTHFFHNLTAFGVGYFTINRNRAGGGWFDREWLDAQPGGTVSASGHVRHVRFGSPLTVMIDGRKNVGVVKKV